MTGYLFIHSFEKRASLSSPHQPVPREVAEPSRQDFALQLHRLVKLKGSASDTLRMAPQKQRKMNELCKVFLNIALQRRATPYAHSFQAQRRHQFGIPPAQYSRSKLIHLFSIACYHCEQWRVGPCGFSKTKALGDKQKDDDTG